jgi:DNA-binding response OmpR family regulator
MGKPRLLIVDDSRMVRVVMKRRLEPLGYEVILCEDGYQAVDLLAEESFDLLILDVVMPGMSGLDLLRVVRQSHSRTQLPVVMASSLSESGDVVEGMRLGANDYVTKPVDFDILSVRLETQLAMREVPSDGSSRNEVDTRSFARSLRPGSVINSRYELLAPIGSGGFAVVWKARQTSTNQEVAIKILRPELLNSAHRTDEAARFKQEMEVIGRLRHPNIVNLVDCGRLGDGQLFTVLEYIEGQSLGQVLKSEGPLRPNEAKHMMLQVLDALSCAHVRGVIHRDLKPHNVMVDSSGVRRNAMVLDFGIASTEWQTIPDADEDILRGSPAYMAPEVLRRRVATVQSDVYSWGLVFLECLIGVAAVQGHTISSIALAQLDERPIPIPEEIPASLRSILIRATAKPCEERYPSVMEALEDLQAVELGAAGETALEVDRSAFVDVWPHFGDDCVGDENTQQVII